MARLLVWLSCLYLCAFALADMHVVYPAFESASDKRFLDLVEILHTALDRTVPEYGAYTLEPSRLGMNEARYMAYLKAGQEINIAWSSTSTDKERAYLPVRIPLRKGILGFRICLIGKDKQAALDKVKTVEDLRKLVIGQGIGWGDVDLYNANGIKVVTAAYDSLFGMVAAGRFDIFPRGIAEAPEEFDTFGKAHPNLAIERGLLIYYPWPYYFFFNKSEAHLAERVEKGLRIMIRDGSFDALFRKYNAAAIDKANLKGRRIIKLENPLLPKETPLDDASLWFDPAKW